MHTAPVIAADRFAAAFVAAAIAVVFAAAAIAVVFAADRLALWMERRGWIYWRKRKPAGRGAGGGGLSGVLTDFQQLVEPQVRHVMEDREERRLVRLSHSADGDGEGKDARRPDRGD